MTTIEWNPAISEETFGKAFSVLIQNQGFSIPSDATSFSSGPSNPVILQRMPKLRVPFSILPDSIQKQAQEFLNASSSSPSSSSSSSDGAQISISVKSLKQPFKFSTTLSVSPTDTIYQVKNLLISKEPTLNSSGEESPSAIPPSSIKLLKKGKVVSDSKTVGDLITAEGEQLAFVAMISATKEQISSLNSSRSDTPASTENPAPESSSTQESDDLPSSVWDAIQSVVASRVGSKKSLEVIERLRKGWELTSKTKLSDSNMDLDLE